MGGILQKQRIGHKRNFWCPTFGARHQTGSQSGGPGVLAIAVEIARGLSPVSAGYLMAFELQPPPNWCQAHKSGGPGVLAIAVEIARGLSPVSAGYLMAFECHSCLAPFGDVWSDPLRAWRLGEKPSSGVPSPPWGSLGLTQRRKDAKTDGEMRDCPRGFLFAALHSSHFTAGLFD